MRGHVQEVQLSIERPAVVRCGRLSTGGVRRGGGVESTNLSFHFISEI